MRLALNTVHIGDARALAGQLAPQSIHTIVTSPPYFGLRSYLPTGHPDKAREMGSEATPDEFVAALVALFAALRPALRDDGTVWLNLGDSYAAHGRMVDDIEPSKAFPKPHKNGPSVGRIEGFGRKQLIGIPWRVAFALQADGWVLRSDIIWHKSNPMPESVRDRPTRSHEYLFLLSKGPRYFYDAEAVKESVTGNTHPKGPKNSPPKSLVHETGREGVKNNASFTEAIPDVVGSRNRRSVWTVNPAAFPDAHYATFPPELVRPCVLAGTSERGCCAACGAPWRRLVERVAAVPDSYNGSSFTSGKSGAVHASRGQGPRYTTTATGAWEPSCRCGAGVAPCTVLDPCMGSGTVAQVAVEEGRNWLGFDLDERAVGWTAGRLAALPVRSLFAASGVVV